MLSRQFNFAFLALALLFISGGCSLYQSDGREFLEKQALSFAASANLQSCGASQRAPQAPAAQEDWLEVSRTDSAIVYGSESEEFAMRVMPIDQSFACAFQFASPTEMIERTDSAIALTLDQTALWLGQ